MTDDTAGEQPTGRPIVLKVLLRQRHLQSHRAFCREYDKVAEKIDRTLKGGYPSKAQFYRWLSGELVGLPYPDHCRILEAMFPGWQVDQLFAVHIGGIEVVPEPENLPVTKTTQRSPQDAEDQRPAAAGNSSAGEIVAAYPYRSNFTTAAWWDLITRATKQIDLLGYTLYFLSLEHPQLVATLREKCANGCIVRVTIADPESPHVIYRDKEEDQPITLVARIRSTIKHFTPLVGVDGFNVHYQDIPLYNSVYRFDDEMLVTPHLYATPGSAAPLLHLRKTGTGGLFSRFESHFEEVWKVTKSADWAISREATSGAN